MRAFEFKRTVARPIDANGLSCAQQNAMLTSNKSLPFYDFIMQDLLQRVRHKYACICTFYMYFICIYILILYANSNLTLNERRACVHVGCSATELSFRGHTHRTHALKKTLTVVADARQSPGAAAQIRLCPQRQRLLARTLYSIA